MAQQITTFIVWVEYEDEDADESGYTTQSFLHPEDETVEPDTRPIKYGCREIVPAETVVTKIEEWGGMDLLLKLDEVNDTNHVLDLVARIADGVLAAAVRRLSPPATAE